MKTNQTFAVIFFPKKDRNKNSTSTVFCRITTNSKRVEFSLKKKVELSEWDSNLNLLRGRTPQAKKFNYYLSDVKSQLHDVYDELRKEQRFITPQLIKARYFGEDEKAKSLLELYDYHYDLSQQTLSEGTLKMYRTTKSYLDLFLKKKMKSNDVFLAQLSFSFLTKFEQFLRTTKLEKANNQMRHNTVMKHIQRLRTIVNLGVKLEWLPKDPFISYKFTYKKSERSYLPLEQLNLLESSVLPSDRLNLVRDLFAFSCYTGLSYIDVMNLTHDHITRGIDGNKWIFTYRAKTEISVKVPLLQQAEMIIEKYKEDPRAINRGHMFPKISNQKMNAYLKEISALLEIDSKLTFHVARHTFATTVTLSNGVPMETVSKLLGHTNITTTQIYAKVIERKVGEDMDKLRESLRNKEEYMDQKKVHIH